MNELSHSNCAVRCRNLVKRYGEVVAAARPRTIEGISRVMNLVMVPMWVFSGIFFSTERFPAAMQPFVHALPLTALNDALRAVMLDGAGLLGCGS